MKRSLGKVLIKQKLHCNVSAHYLDGLAKELFALLSAQA
jgi:hypothetical protein